MAISAVHYPFHNKSCCLLQPPFGSGAQRCFLIFQLTGKALGLSFRLSNIAYCFK